MGNPGDNSQPIPCEEIVLRVATHKRHITADGFASADLFILRPSDNGGLSVYRQSLATPEQCERSFRKAHGTVTLHTGRIRDIGLRVGRPLEIVSDEQLNDAVPGHSLIMGLPEPSEAEAEAEYMASLLRDHSRPVKRPADHAAAVGKQDV